MHPIIFLATWYMGFAPYLKAILEICALFSVHALARGVYIYTQSTISLDAHSEGYNITLAREL